MKIEKKRERELAERQGSTKTTLIYGTWLLVSLVAGYFFFSYLDSSGIFTMRALRGELRLPASVPEWAVMIGAVLVFAIAAQIALSFGFLLASPAGRRKAGKGDLSSRHRDLDDRH